MADTRTRLPLPEPDKSETHGFEGWSFGVDGAKKTSDHTYKIHWWREAKMHAHASAVSDAENAALRSQASGQSLRVLEMTAENAALRERLRKMSDTMKGMDAHEAGLAEAQDHLMYENKTLRRRVDAHAPCNGYMTGNPPRYTPECIVLAERVKVLEDALRKLLMGEEADLTLESYAAAAEHARAVLAARKAAP